MAKIIDGIDVKNTEFYTADTQDMANTLCLLAVDNPSQELIKEFESALYHLKAASENSYNSDYFRVMFRVLERVCDNSKEFDLQINNLCDILNLI